MSVANLQQAAVPASFINIDAAAASIGSTAAIAGATTLLPSQSGCCFTVSKAAAYAITLPAPSAANVGLRYYFVGGATVANAVSLSCGAAVLSGYIINATPAVVSCAGGTTLTLAATSAPGDTIELLYVTANLISVRAVTSAAAGITVAP